MIGESEVSKKKMHNRIKELRARFNLTRDDLANKVRVRRETIVFLEKGKYNPSLKLAHDISVAFNSRIEDVFLFEENTISDL
jgi:putative transcriptional regulator